MAWWWTKSRILNPGDTEFKVNQVMLRADAEKANRNLAAKKQAADMEPHCDYLSAWEEDKYIIAQANVGLDEKGKITVRTGERARGRQLRAGSREPDPVHGRQPEAVGVGSRELDSVPRKRRREPCVDGIEHAAASRSAAARRCSLRGHRHGAGDGAGFGCGHHLQTSWNGGFGRQRAHHRARGRQFAGRAAFPRGGRGHLYDDQVQALKPEHLHQPKADRAAGAARQEGRRSGGRSLHGSGRAGAGAQRSGGVHAVARVQLRGRHRGVREAGEGRLLYLDPHRRIRSGWARHQAGTGGNHARYSEHRRGIPAQPGRERHHSHRRNRKAGRHSGGQSDSQGRDATDA